MNAKGLTIRRGRPTKYNRKMPGLVTDYTNKCVKSGDFPTIEQLSTQLGVGTRTLYDWEGVYPEFSQTLETLRQTQRHLLITNGLNDKYNARFAVFLLKATHGMNDTKPLFEATQNNIFNNLSPEVLADALKLMKENKTLENGGL